MKYIIFAISILRVVYEKVYFDGAACVCRGGGCGAVFC